MTQFKGGSAVCLLLCLAVVSASSSHFSKELTFGKKHLILSKESLVGTTLLYGACDFSDNAKPDVSCEVILETFNFDGTSKKLTCDVELPTHHTEDVYVARVGRDKAVLAAVDGTEEQHLHLANVDLTTCKTIHRKVETPHTKTNWTASDLEVVGYEGTYDVLFFHADRAADTNWKGTYDIEGNLVSAIAPWTDIEATHDSWTFVNAKYQSPDGGYIFIRSGENKITVLFVDGSGKKVLKEWNVSKKDFSTELFYDNNETVSACIYNIKEVNAKCLLFGPQGVEKGEISLDFAPFYVASVPNGYVTVHPACKDNKTSIAQNCEEFTGHIRHLNSEGQLIKEQPLKTFSRKNIILGQYAAHVFQNDAEEACVSYVQFFNDVNSHLWNQANKLTVTAECFADL